MFTFPIACDLNSEIGQRISFVQHLVSTAVVHGIRTLPGYEVSTLCVKMVVLFLFKGENTPFVYGMSGFTEPRRNCLGMISPASTYFIL